MECKVPDDCEECRIQGRAPKINWYEIIRDLKPRIKGLWYSACEFFGIEDDSLPGILLTDLVRGRGFALPAYDEATDTIILPPGIGNWLKYWRVGTPYTCHEVAESLMSCSLAHELGERAVSKLGIVEYKQRDKEMRERVEYVCEAFCEHAGLLVRHPTVGHPEERKVKELCKKIESVPPHQRKDTIKKYIEEGIIG